MTSKAGATGIGIPRFDTKFVVDDSHSFNGLPCWTWRACLNRQGYGQFSYGGRSGGVQSAHRFAYELVNGPVDRGLDLDHLCRNRACVNPSHLEPVSHRENVLRGLSPTADNAAKTHCLNRHEFTPENTISVRNGTGRLCRECRGARWEKACALRRERRRSRRAST